MQYPTETIDDGEQDQFSPPISFQYTPNPERLAIERREPEAKYPFADDEPTPRWCWRCERETKQVRAESGGETWWMCNVCYECERQEWQELRSASQSLAAAVRQRFNPLRLLAWLREKGK